MWHLFPLSSSGLPRGSMPWEVGRWILASRARMTKCFVHSSSFTRCTCTSVMNTNCGASGENLSVSNLWLSPESPAQRFLVRWAVVDHSHAASRPQAVRGPGSSPDLSRPYPQPMSLDDPLSPDTAPLLPSHGTTRYRSAVCAGRQCEDYAERSEGGDKFFGNNFDVRL